MPTPAPCRPLWRRILGTLLALLIRLAPVLLAALLCALTRHWLTGSGHTGGLLAAVSYLLSTVLLLACAVQFWRSA